MASKKLGNSVWRLALCSSGIAACAGSDAADGSLSTRDLPLNATNTAASVALGGEAETAPGDLAGPSNADEDVAPDLLAVNSARIQPYPSGFQGVPRDYDGDGKADLSVKTHEGAWLIDYASDGFGSWNVGYEAYGPESYQPAPADYDGDGKADLSVKTHDGEWFIDYASDGFGSWNVGYSAYGPESYRPVPADYDGDGKADLSVKTDGGEWFIDYASDGFGSWNVGYAAYGPESYRPVPADYDGDGKADLSVKTDGGEWFIDYASDGFGFWNVGYSAYGPESYRPVPADYDGDGKADLSVKTDGGEWFIDHASNGFGSWNVGYQAYGPESYRPVPADFDGDTKVDLAAVTDEGWALLDLSANGSGGWELQDPLFAPAEPVIRLNSVSKTSLWTTSIASRAKRMIISLRGVAGTQRTSSYDSDNANFFGLEPGTEYCVEVEAWNDEGSSRSTRCFETESAPPPPPPSTPPTQGIKQVSLFNCHSERRDVYVWTQDVTQGFWQERGRATALWNGSSCPGSSAPFTISLQDGRYFLVVAVDPSLPGCGVNDPTYGACRRYVQAFKGDADGLTLPILLN